MDIRVLEWLFTTLQPRTTIQQMIDNLAELVRKGRKRVLSIAGEEHGTIYLPIKRTDLDWYIQNSTELASSLLSSGANLEVRPLASPVLKWMTQRRWLVIPKLSRAPLQNAITVFMDAGQKSGKAVAMWCEDQQWRHRFLHAPLIFVAEKRCEIGDCMWDRVLQGKAKDATALGSTWQIVINTLKTMRVEAKVAAAATQVIAAPAETVSSNFPKNCSRIYNLFRGSTAAGA